MASINMIHPRYWTARPRVLKIPTEVFTSSMKDSTQLEKPHISIDRLRRIAGPSLVRTGCSDIQAIFNPEEAKHFRECSFCIDTLADIVRDLVRERESKTGTEG
jgi:hypothetical protein